MASQGIHGVLFDLCPGFEPVSVVIQDGPGGGIPPGRSCLHVCQGPTRRGFAAVCSHAEAERIVVAAAAARSAALAAERPPHRPRPRQTADAARTSGTIAASSTP